MLVNCGGGLGGSKGEVADPSVRGHRGRAMALMLQEKSVLGFTQGRI